MLDAYNFVKSNGIVRESDYPTGYNARKGRCLSTNGKEKFFINNMIEEDEISNDRIKVLLT